MTSLPRCLSPTAPDPVTFCNFGHATINKLVDFLLGYGLWLWLRFEGVCVMGDDAGGI